MNKPILMPSELTAENGAKYVFLGEFEEEVEVACHECTSTGADEDCEFCEGSGTYTTKIEISWTTIKNIYALAVEKMAIEGKNNV